MEVCLMEEQIQQRAETSSFDLGVDINLYGILPQMMKTMPSSEALQIMNCLREGAEWFS